MILITNLGNRDLTYMGKDLVNKDQKLSFYDFSKFLLENLESEKEKIQIQILDEILQKHQDSISICYLIASDQAGIERKNQDTIFSAQILEKLIAEKFSLPVKILINKFPVSNENQQIKFFYDTLRKLQNEHPAQQFIICDGPGTCQMRTALKISSEYLFKSTEKIYYYVNQREIGQSNTELLTRSGYREIIDKEIIYELIRKGSYLGALDLLQQIFGVNKKFIFLLELGKARIETRIDFCKKIIKENFSKKDALVLKVKQMNFVEKFSAIPLDDSSSLNQTMDDENWDAFVVNHKFTPEDSIYLQELLLKSKWHYQRKEGDYFILTLHIFIETYLAASISRNSKYDILGDYNSVKKKLSPEIWQSSISLQGFFKDAKIHEGLVWQILFLQDILPQNCMVLLNSIKNCISWFNEDAKKRSRADLSSLRNGIAHKGKVPEWKKLIEEQQEIINLFLKFEENTGLKKIPDFEKMNIEISDIFLNFS